MRGILGKLFHKETNEELEEKLTQELIEEEEENIRRIQEQEIPATVIKYVMNDDDEQSVRIEVVCEDFSAKIMPDTGSIIWITVEGVLTPFKCIRYDYICNNSDYDSMRTYIVVDFARPSDILEQHGQIIV